MSETSVLAFTVYGCAALGTLWPRAGFFAMFAALGFEHFYYGFFFS
jgi:hypothetical protein